MDALGIVPYAILSKIIILNDTIGSWIGFILLISVFNIVRDQFGLFWIDVMGQEDIRSPIVGTLGAWLVTIGSLVGIFYGLFTSSPTIIVPWISFGTIIIGNILM